MAKSPDNRKPETARRRKGFEHAAATARGAVDRIAGKQGFAEANVLLNWPAIAGAELAATCQPVRVTYGAQRTLGATLIVQASSARAPEIEMKGPIIVERVNQYYGYRAISRLKVTQSTGFSPTPGFSEVQAAFTGPDGTPTPAEEARAAEMAADIQSPGLRAALGRMGANVLARDRTRTGKTS